MSQVKYDTKKYSSKYNQKLASQQERCECGEMVKLISMPKHKLGKKHIEKINKLSNDITDEVIKTAELLKEKNSKKSHKQIIIDLYYLIQAQYFDEDGCEALEDDEHYIMPETKNEEELEFCSQPIGHISDRLEELAEETNNVGILPSDAEPIDIRMGKMDYSQRDAKKQALSIFRAYKKLLKQHLEKQEEPEESEEPVVAVEQTKMTIKTIDYPSSPKSILKKKVEIMVEEEESNSDAESINILDEDFIPVSRFYKMELKDKQDHLEFLLNNYMGFFEHHYDDLVEAYENVEYENDYLSIYRMMVQIKESKRVDEEED